MRIAVIADTHDQVPGSLVERLRGASEIWHLGDVCAPATLLVFEALGVPLCVVRGNCDWQPHWPTALNLVRAGADFHLVHIPPRRAPAGAVAILHGHTHVPRDETDPCGVRWLNPGCITRPNRGAPPSYAWLELSGRGTWTWKLELL